MRWPQPVATAETSLERCWRNAGLALSVEAHRRAAGSLVAISSLASLFTTERDRRIDLSGPSSRNVPSYRGNNSQHADRRGERHRIGWS